MEGQSKEDRLFPLYTDRFRKMEIAIYLLVHMHGSHACAGRQTFPGPELGIPTRGRAAEPYPACRLLLHTLQLLLQQCQAAGLPDWRGHFWPRVAHMPSGARSIFRTASHMRRCHPS